MRLQFTHERLLAIVAHPDDAELLCAGTLARAKADGAAIGVCVLCRGDKGQSVPPIDNLAAVRSREMKLATVVLGTQLFEGGYADAQLFDSAETRQAVVDLVRQFRPTLVLAHSPNDYHPDHRAASSLAEAASWFCASAGHRTSFAPLEKPPALWWLDTVEMIDFDPHFYVDVSDFIDIKLQMLRCHKSQLARGRAADFSPLEGMMLRQCEVRGAQAGVRAAEAFRQHAAWKRVGAW